MTTLRRFGMTVSLLAVIAGSAFGGDDGRLLGAIDALQRGLDRVEAAADAYPAHRDCFSCHHQTLPIVAMTAASRAGVEVNEDVLDATVAFTAESFSREIEDLERGTGIGGRSMTVGYGLWAFNAASRPPDALSDAMAVFLLKNHQSNGRWESNTGRPPLEGSHAMCTTLAAFGLKENAPLLYRSLAKETITEARSWLLTLDPDDQEDRAAKLWGLWLLDTDPEAIDAARAAVLEAQRDDGGWSQLDGLEQTSDAYATGQALAILAWTGTATDSTSYRRGLRFLIDTQCSDGSWFVETRAHPFQAFFENGDPHGESQFISTAATCWAVAALAESMSPRIGDTAPTGDE